MDNPQFFLFGMATGLALSAAVQFVVYQVAGYRNVPVLTADAVGLVSAVPATQKLMDKLTSQLSVSSKSLQNIVLHMVAEFKKGLAQDGQVMKMIPSYVRHLPTGNETGSVLALDMGGSNFRVLHAKLEGAGRIKTIQRKWALTEAYKHIAGPKLFDFFAECVSSFIKEERLGDGPHKLGFTFSFPVHQTAINRGSLMEWAKGFDNEGVEGQDVVLLLEAAFKRRKLDISVTALVNDTVGTLVTHCYQDPKTYIAVILGTGTNAAYVEKACNVTKWTESEGDVVINTEWGAYGEPSILPITQYDHELDRASANPKKHMFEKMISGLYMGELTRVIMMDLVASGNLFKGIGSTQLGTRHLFDTAYMSRIERYRNFNSATTHRH